MDDELKIVLSEELRQQAADLATTRGATVENVVREAIEYYVSTYSPVRSQPLAPVEPRTELGARLKMLRGLILDSETSLLGWEDLQRELAERRGERDHAAPDLR